MHSTKQTPIPPASSVTYLIGLLSMVLFSVLTVRATDNSSSGILKQLDIAPVWSVHQVGPPHLLTQDGRQYVLYYDHDRFMTIASRSLGEDAWQYFRFPVQMNWQTGGHAKTSLAIDRDGYLHVACYRRRMQIEPAIPPHAIYYRSSTPHSIAEFERVPMVPEGVNPHYPTFYKNNEDLFFSFRRGGSGRGDQLLNRYDSERRVWVQALDTPLLDGAGERNAYVQAPHGPVPGPDGRWHLVWVWRETPCHSTNHSISYARTVGTDLNQWESAAGAPVSPPFTVGNRELLVDDTPVGGGMSNVLQGFSFDSQDRVVVSYHRFDDDGASQIYNARFEDGQWRIVPATNWDYVWGDDYSGSGALNISSHVRMSTVTPIGDGELTQQVFNRDDGSATLVLDEESLAFLRYTTPPPTPEWKEAILRPESDFQITPIPRLRRAGGPMQVNLISDSGEADLPGVSYLLRWEHGGQNRDRPVPKPWPEPTMLRLYKIQDAGN